MGKGGKGGKPKSASASDAGTPKSGKGLQERWETAGERERAGLLTAASLSAFCSLTKDAPAADLARLRDVGALARKVYIVCGRVVQTRHTRIPFSD